jgi:integrase
VKNHILPALGARPLAQINNAKQVEQLSDSLLQSGHSPDTARRVENTLGYILKRAKRQRYINYNPVEDADKPSPRRRTPNLPTVEQLYALADAAPPESGNLILFAAFTGMRMSELLGLRWTSVDLTEGPKSSG